MARRKPSIYDVAKVAGVSHQTVSRVLNLHNNVSDPMRQKVLSAMADLEFRPNQTAKALATGKTSTIGVLSHNTTLFGPASMLHAVQNSARELGYTINIVSLKSIDHQSIVEGIEELVRVGVDGIVIIAPLAKGVGPLPHVSDYLPAVLVEGEPISAIPSLNFNQFSGAAMAVEHLIALGHKRIAHISGPKNWYEAQQRMNGWRNTLLKSGLKADLIVAGDWSPQSGYDAVKELMVLGKPTAIFAGNDGMALGALKALSELGISVPTQMSLVGFDNMPEAPFLVPGLSTVNQDLGALGNQCVNLLVKLINHEDTGDIQLAFEPVLIIRGSTARAESK